MMAQRGDNRAMTMDASSPTTPASGALFAGETLVGRDAFAAALRAVLCTPPEPVRTLWLVDEAFGGWPLDEPTVLESLGRWLRRGGRTVHLIGGDFAALAHGFPRFSAWRRDYAHALRAWQPAEGERVELDALCACERGSIQLLDREAWRARVVTEAPAVRAIVERVEALLHRCQSAWPATPLGL
jgi:hypothetical protein